MSSGKRLVSVSTSAFKVPNTTDHEEEEEFYTNPLTNQAFSGRYWQLLDHRKELPVYSFKKKILDTVRDHPVTVLVGETGSGKTTQVPQFLLLSDILQDEQGICCTQPRRVAAVSIAERVAEEMDTQVGQYVGYTIRFEDNTSEKTKLKYLTDGMLLREIMHDPLLSRYKIVVIDEAHERTVSTDVLLGVLKELLKKRSDLKIVVMSATLNAEKFISYFSGAPYLEVPGRMFDVRINYLEKPVRDYLESAISTVIEIHQTEEPGDILLFLTGEEEIEEAVSRISFECNKNPGIGGYAKVLPLYAALPSSQQKRIFEPAPKKGRKIVVSTNIAETSITIDGVVYAVDPGFCKQKYYNPRTRIESLPVIPISKASAKQRSGRAGRTRPGKCFRLYTEKAYHEKLLEQSHPEMLRSNITAVTLQMLRLGISDLVHFDWPDPPAPESLMRALELLLYLEAIDDNCKLTSIGDKLAAMPLDPQLSKMIILACDPKYDLFCGEAAITIAALLSVPPILVRPSDKKKDADQAHEQFLHEDGDHLTLLNIYHAYLKNLDSPDWAVRNFVSIRSLRNADKIRAQLENLCQRLDLSLESHQPDSPEYHFNVRKALAGGFFSQVAHMYKKGHYLTIKDNQEVTIHPSSCLSGDTKWVVFHEFMRTSKQFIRTASSIDPRWLLELAPLYYDLEEMPESPAKNDLLMVSKILEKQRR
ncbi:hypothetical protein P9112_013815 [Eukaryota sp. TZLM1-RC]